MKPPLYYAVIKTSFYNYRVMRVTSEKYNQAFGSTKIGGSTHCALHDVQAKFDTEDKAEAAVDKIKEIKTKYEKLREPFDKELSKLYVNERNEIKQLMRDA